MWWPQGRLLWEQPTASQGWIAGHLQISSAAYMSQLLKRTAKEAAAPALPPAFAKWLTPVKR